MLMQMIIQFLIDSLQIFCRIQHNHNMHPQTLQATFSVVQLSIPNTYGYVLLVAAVFALQILIIGFALPGAGRKVFTKEFLQKNFGAEHKAATGSEIQKGGYPDMGSGRYAEKLTYKQWYEFNNAQRGHYNLLEIAPSAFVFLLIAGIYFPIAAAGIGAVLIVARALYAIGYVKGGPKGRIAGVLLNTLCTLGLLGLGITSAIKLINGETI